MANDQADFAPAVRNAAWWSGDSRQAVAGKAVDQILIKQGKLIPEDISDRENVRMGHVMQPVILGLVQDRLGIEIKDADYALTHPRETWLKSHFDGIEVGGNMLVEAKNYTAAIRSKYDFETGRIPETDMAQLVHESAVHNIPKVCFAVLFGGQEFCYHVFDISDEQRNELISTMATYWGHVQAGTTPPAETVEQAKLLYPQSTEGVITANQSVEQAVAMLKQMKSRIKAAEEEAEQLEVQLRNMMGGNSELRSVDGSTLITWKSSKASEKFSAELFKQSMPDIYKQFIISTPGSRRFLIK